MSKLIDQVKADEGLSLTPYRCTEGRLTIGYGRNLDDVGITDAEADYLLKNDLKRVVSDLKKKLAFFDDLNNARKRALVNMGFQLGVNGLMKFSKMLNALENKNWDSAAKHALDSAWAQQTPERAKRIAERLRKGKD